MRGRLVAVAVLVLAVLGVGLVATRWLEHEPERVEARRQATQAPVVRTDASAPEPETPTSVIETVEGRAIRRSPGQPAAPIVKGDRLPAESTVETSGGSLTIVTPEGVQVEVADESELRLAGPSEEGADIVLARGRVEAQSNGEVFRMGFAGSDTIATVEDGDFSAVNDGDGQVAVASTRGEVAVAANGEEVVVGAGTQTAVRGGRPPSAPTKIPSSFFLKVRRPRISNESQTVLKGKTAPGSIVMVDDKAVVVGRNGRFEADVTLDRGSNKVAISARDALGRKASEEVSIVYQKKDPSLESKVVW